jgi:hypothetical protein
VIKEVKTITIKRVRSRCPSSGDHVGYQFDAITGDITVPGKETVTYVISSGRLSTITTDATLPREQCICVEGGGGWEA